MPVTMKLFAAVLAAAVAVSATPAPPTCKTTQQQANFDELPNNSVLPGPVIPVGYKGLYWQSFIVANTDSVGVPLASLQPKSPINYAVTITATQLLGTPLLSTHYANSTVTSFTLQDFYFGCAVNLGQGAVGIPAQCLVSIAGYRGKDDNIKTSQQVCAQQFLFDPKSNLDPETVQFSGAVKGCEDVQFVVIQYTLTGGGAVLDADNGLALDNVRFTTKSC